jgi:hypothetical protein
MESNIPIFIVSVRKNYVDLVEVSDAFKADFLNAGVCINYKITTSE